MQKYDEEIDRVKAKYKDNGRVSHLVHLRNLRVKFGRKLMGLPRSNASVKLDPAPNPFPDVKNDIPELPFQDITPSILSGAIQHHGALIARNFFPNETVERLRRGIDKTFEESSKNFSDDADLIDAREPNSPWFRLDLPFKDVYNNGSVGFMLMTGSVWTFLSPAVCHQLLSAFDDTGLKSKLETYLGGRACMSFNKSVLRRMEPLKAPSEWHQDGAFMTENIKSINVWIALSDCGADTDCPGMDFIPKRLNKIMPTGGEHGAFDWSVSPQSIEKWFKDCPPVQPSYKAGDAIFFDHYNLHATSFSPDYKQKRYAIETWFFAEEFAAHNQNPTYW